MNDNDKCVLNQKYKIMLVSIGNRVNYGNKQTDTKRH